LLEPSNSARTDGGIEAGSCYNSRSGIVFSSKIPDTHSH